MAGGEKLTARPGVMEGTADGHTDPESFGTGGDDGLGLTDTAGGDDVPGLPDASTSGLGAAGPADRREGDGEGSGDGRDGPGPVTFGGVAGGVGPGVGSGGSSR
ncbi:hypothetical protein [Streptomyces sp. NRRL F-2580]|uniref:hypothetical protein n=1 Tax=Streptomyces sp. NRRL F-2580 TaxID=1463841 RepID=UPI0004CB1477|nr:hypothetical protein [Streptomyces sp. NRRL F-2580]